MAIYTHTAQDDFRPNTFVKMIVSDATAEEIGLGAEWSEIDPQEVADTEELCGCEYIKTTGLSQIDMRRTESGIAVRRYGRL